MNDVEITLYERREYNDGIKYIPFTGSPVPGKKYYRNAIDDNNQVYYIKVPAAGPANLSDTNLTYGEYMYQLGQLSSLQLAICITSIFIHTFVYLIGFPFIISRYQLLARNHPDQNIKKQFRIFRIIGWINWTLHFGMLILFCTFWIPTICREGYGWDYCVFAGIYVILAWALLLIMFGVVVAVVGKQSIDTLKPNSAEMVDRV